MTGKGPKTAERSLRACAVVFVLPGRMNDPAKGNVLGKEAEESNMVNWNKVVANMGRGMDPMSAYNRAERKEREERRKRMERLRGAKPDRRGGC